MDVGDLLLLDDDRAYDDSSIDLLVAIAIEIHVR